MGVQVYMSPYCSQAQMQFGREKCLQVSVFEIPPLETTFW